MTEPWRDEEKLPLKDLNAAMATWDTDGQRDDETGNDAGAEDEFGHDPQVRGADDARPSTTGRTGPG